MGLLASHGWVGPNGIFSVLYVSKMKGLGEATAKINRFPPICLQLPTNLMSFEWTFGDRTQDVIKVPTQAMGNQTIKWIKNEGKWRNKKKLTRNNLSDCQRWKQKHFFFWHSYYLTPQNDFGRFWKKGCDRLLPITSVGRGGWAELCEEDSVTKELCACVCV